MQKYLFCNELQARKILGKLKDICDINCSLTINDMDQTCTGDDSNTDIAWSVCSYQYHCTTKQYMIQIIIQYLKIGTCGRYLDKGNHCFPGTIDIHLY